MDKVLEIIKKLALPIILVIIFIGIVVGIVNFQKGASGPELTITEPKEGITTEEGKTTINGSTDDSNNNVFVNEEEVEVNDDGTFSAEVPLIKGNNEISVEVISEDGQFATESVMISRVAKGTPSAPKGETSPKTGNGANGGNGSPEKDVLGESVPKQAPEETPEVNGKSTLPSEPLAEAGPKENAVFGSGALLVVIFFYRKSKKTLNVAIKSNI